MNNDQLNSGRVQEADVETLAVVDIDPDQVSSPALRRLLEEVRNEETGCAEQPYAYDRVHNKHNR